MPSTLSVKSLSVVGLEGGGGEKFLSFFFPTNFFFEKCSWGPETPKKIGGAGGDFGAWGKRYTFFP